MWWGSANGIKGQNLPIELNISDKFNEDFGFQGKKWNEFFPIRLESNWSKSLSLITLRVAYSGNLPENYNVK